jgi:hypothetical protein
VLGGEHHGVDADGDAVLVTQRDLALGVRAQPGQCGIPLLAHLGLLLDQTVRIVDRRRHQFGGLVAGVAEHQALVAGALFFGILAVHAHVDIGRLLADHVQDAAGGSVEADVGGVVADVADDLAHQRFQVDPGAGGDLAGDDRHAGLDHRLAGHARALVLGQDRIEYRVRNLVGDLVGVAFGNGFGSEQIFGHRAWILVRFCGSSGQYGQSAYTDRRIV